MNEMVTNQDRIAGVLFGVAVGDSIGLPAEGLSRKRIAAGNWNPWRQRMLFGRGMVSDDTEQTALVAEAILASRGDVGVFEKSMAAGLRRWFLAAPPGIGWATMRACLKLCIGISPAKCGVFSAGNGPAMRSGIIGAMFPNDEKARETFVGISTRMTHSDPVALIGARMVAELVATGCGGEAIDLEKLSEIAEGATESEAAIATWREALAVFRESMDQGISVAAFAGALGYEKAVPGYIVPSVMVAVYAWLRHGDFGQGLAAVLNCGGDTDTNAAIFGALAGASGGIRGIPAEWISKIRDWPCSVDRLKLLATALGRPDAEDSGRTCETVRIFRPLPLILLRNLAFFFLLLAHLVIRRLNFSFSHRSQSDRRSDENTGMPPSSGFRFSGQDAAVLAIGGLATWIWWMKQPFLAPALPIVLGHFFLFCNVFRISRRSELIWAGIFLVNAISWAAASPGGGMNISWPALLLVQTPVTAGLIVLEMLRPGYHGVGASLLSKGHE